MAIYLTTIDQIPERWYYPQIMHFKDTRFKCNPLFCEAGPTDISRKFGDFSNGVTETDSIDHKLKY